MYACTHIQHQVTAGQPCEWQLQQQIIQPVGATSSHLAYSGAAAPARPTFNHNWLGGGRSSESSSCPMVAGSGTGQPVDLDPGGRVWQTEEPAKLRWQLQLVLTVILWLAWATHPLLLMML